jgi:hypothetical protein
MPRYEVHYRQTEYRRCWIEAPTVEEAVRLFAEEGASEPAEFVDADNDQEIMDVKEVQT